MTRYDKNSVESIVQFATGLIGRSLSEAVELPASVSEYLGKGKLGQLVEEFYFEIKPPNNHEPDFPEAGLELKTAGVVLTKQHKVSAKERLVLTNINFGKLGYETWESSSFLAKCKLMLLLFYLYESEVLEINRKFVLSPLLVDLFALTDSDLSQIESDWRFIQERVRQNRAHELSEGDTTYLKACRKGSGGADERLAPQNGSALRAQTRAFSFPASFVTRLIRNNFSDEQSILVNTTQTVEEATRRRLGKFLGLTVDEICSRVGWSSSAKNLHSLLVRRMLTGTGKKPLELEKAQIALRTITIRENGLPTENFPFASFDFSEVASQGWEESTFIEDLEKRYLLAVFLEDAEGVKRFHKAGYWTMPYDDRLASKEVWIETKRRINANNYDLPKRKDHSIAFVNTHGRDSRDLVRTPQGGLQTRRSFWLNRHYLAEVIENSLAWEHREV